MTTKKIKDSFNTFKNLNNNFISSDVLNEIRPLTNFYFEEDYNELENFNLVYQNLYFSSYYGHLQWLLTKWDKSSMASSIEMRAPFMDWNVFEYALAVPAELKIADGYNKSILRKTFTSLITKEIAFDKRKQGLGAVSITLDENFKVF